MDEVEASIEEVSLPERHMSVMDEILNIVYALMSELEDTKPEEL